MDSEQVDQFDARAQHFRFWSMIMRWAVTCVLGIAVLSAARCEPNTLLKTERAYYKGRAEACEEGGAR